MNHQCIYLDNQSTTPCDPRVIEAIQPFWLDTFANAHSVHAAGREAREHYDRAITEIAAHWGATPTEIVLTSGATEANNLAIFGVALHPRQKRRQIITVETEHPAVLDPLQQLSSAGFEVIRLPVGKQAGQLGSERAGQIDLDQLAATISEHTCLVSVMAANNEIGTLADLKTIAELCHQHGALLHTDATQAVGKLPIDVDQWDVDLLSASAHKAYGPKGIGLLFVRQRGRRVRLRPMIWGGGQQGGLRSGTLPVADAVAMAMVLRIAAEDLPQDAQRIGQLTASLWSQLRTGIEGLRLNGPPLSPTQRLLGNLNICFPNVEGEALMNLTPDLAISSGSACSSANPAPSHVLSALGLEESAARRSLRFGVGRFNTQRDIDQAVLMLCEAYHALLAEFG